MGELNPSQAALDRSVGGLGELRGVAMERNDVLALAQAFAAELGIEVLPEGG